MLDLPPAMTRDVAERIAFEQYGLRTVAQPLGGERDRNFKLVTPDGQSFVLKLSLSGPEPALEMQTRALQYLNQQKHTVSVPRVIAALNGKYEVQLPGDDNRGRTVRLLTFVPGRIASSVSERQEMPRLVAAAAATLDAALVGFEDPAADR